MDRLSLELARVCRRRLFAEKILVASDYASGNSLLESLAGEGVPWLNVRVQTPDTLALETTRPLLAAKGLTPLSGIAGVFLIENIFRSLHTSLRYFKGLEPRPGIIKALHRAIYDLRLAGVGPADLVTAAFTEPDKRNDLILVLRNYEKALSEGGLADPADIYRLATEAAQGQSDDRLFLVPESFVLRPYQKTFLINLAGSNLVILPTDPVYGLSRPRFAWETADETAVHKTPASHLERLPWLYGTWGQVLCPHVKRCYSACHTETSRNQPDLDTAFSSTDGVEGDVFISPQIETVSDDRSVAIFAAYGESNEAAEVLRRIKSGNLPFDQVTVAYTSGDYIWHFYRLAARCRLPVTFGEGIPLLLTRPGRALKGLLTWIEGDFQVVKLNELLLGGLIIPGKDLPEPVQCADIIREAGIGWGRDRYLPRLVQLAVSYAKRALHSGRSETAEENSCRSERAAVVDGLRAWIEKLLQEIPIPDSTGLISLKLLAGRLVRVAQEFAAITNEIDAVGLTTASEYFQQYASAPDILLPFPEALERLRREVASLQVAAQSPKPGRLHVTHYRNAGWTKRPNTFVVGLDAGRFPGSGPECPVLLDRERGTISPALALGREQPAEALYTLVQFLASLRGRLTLSYSTFDTVAMRPYAPATILMKAFRLLHGTAADSRRFHRELQPPVGFEAAPGAWLDPDEWWLSMLKKRDNALDSQLVSDCYPWLKRGLHALAARRSENLTAYDGKVSVAPGRFDPRFNEEIILSASQIECLASCPFSFFLRYGLGLEKPNDQPLDPWRWLDPATLGSLLHEIFRRYLGQLTAEGGRHIPHNKQLLLDIAEELITRASKEIPFPSVVVREQEERGIARSLEVFLACEEMSPENRPLGLEIPFGLGEQDVQKAGLGLADPVVITLSDGRSLRLCGRIDRLDETPGGYVVIDYKTGSYKKFEGPVFICGGKQIQHALYAIAAEQILKSARDPAAAVRQSGYYFPTERGQGRRIIRIQEDRAPILRTLELLCDLLQSGTFIAAGGTDNCAYCDYDVVCGIRITQGMLEKLTSGADPVIAAWREAREHV